MFYYAYIDAENIVVNVYAMPSEIPVAGYIPITEDQYNDPTLIGKVYDPDTGLFEDPPMILGSTDNITVGETTQILSDKLEDMDGAITENTNKAHEHTNKTVLDGITAEKINAWDAAGSGAGVPGADGEDGEDGGYYTPAVDTAGNLTWTASKEGMPSVTGANIKGEKGDKGDPGDGANVTAEELLTKLKTVDGQNSGLDADMLDGHDATYFATATQLAGKAAADHTHTDYAAATHTHTDYAATNHEHDYAAENHTHSEYAQSTHTHTGYADASHTHTPASIGAAATTHTHSNYAPSSHTHSGYASSSHTHSEYADTDHTHSQYSLSGHSHTTNGSCTFTGTIRTYDIVPDANDTRNIGGYSNRYKFIYSVNQLQVSSDERMKKDIKGLSDAEMLDFVDALRVVEYKYKNDEDNKPRIGLIAQEVVKANPEIAPYFIKEESDGMLGLSAADLVFPLIAAVKELKKQIEELKK